VKRGEKWGSEREEEKGDEGNGGKGERN